MFIAGSTNEIDEYTLSTPFEISSQEIMMEMS